MNARLLRTIASAATLLSAATAGAEPALPQQLIAAEDRNDRPAVVEICRRLVEADPDNLDALRKLVRTSFDLGDLENTRRYLARLKESVGADDPGVLETEGDLLARAEKHDQAVAAWQAALKADPDNAGLLAKLGNYFLNTGKDRDNAAFYFTRLLKLRNNASDHIIVAEAAAMRRDWNTLIERTSALKNDFAADRTAKRKVPSLERLIDATMKIAALDERIGTADAPLPVILERGILFRSLGFPEIGLIDARRALKLAPDTLYARMGYAIIGSPIWSEHERIKAWDINPYAFREHVPVPSFLQQLIELESAIRANPSDIDKLLERAGILRVEEQMTLAFADIDAALAADPDSPLALRLKADGLHDMGRYGLSVPLIERALALQPEDPEILRTGIKIFASQGEYRRAITLCDTFLKSGSDPKINKQRTLYYERLQQKPPVAP